MQSTFRRIRIPIYSIVVLGIYVFSYALSTGYAMRSPALERSNERWHARTRACFTTGALYVHSFMRTMSTVVQR